MQPMVNIALRAAREAGEMIVKSADNLDLIKVDEKGRHDFVTEVDRRSEETIIYHIKKAYPDHAFLGEETGRSGDQRAMSSGLLTRWTAPQILFAAFHMSLYLLPAESRASSSTQ